MNNSNNMQMSPMNQRRLRANPWIRELVQEYQVTPQKLIQPLFVVEGISEREMIPGLKGTYRETETSLLKTIESDLKAGVTKFLLFGVPQEKKEKNFSADFTSSQIQSIKKNFGSDLFLGVDVCLCSYTSHGHCGILSAEADHVENSSSVQELARMANAYAEAGADCVAPSDMMDGRIQAIRNLLDKNHLNHTLLMSYSAKFHSRFYGPFRVAADAAPKSNHLKDRSTYQIDPSCARDALESSLRDAREGADILMVKPGLPYLDILYRLSQEIQKPWAVYQVSGEYASIEVLAEKGLMDARLAHLECWTAFLRAGASMIITYGARYAQEYLRREN